MYIGSLRKGVTDLPATIGLEKRSGETVIYVSPQKICMFIS